MELRTLQDLLRDQVEDLYSAEMQLLKIMPRVSGCVFSDELKEAFEHHITETEVQLARLERIGQLLEVDLGGKTCRAMQGLAAEAVEALLLEGEVEMRDLAVIAALRRIEHYEMSAYASALELANSIGRKEIVKLLDETLREEEQLEQTLTVLSEDLIDEMSYRHSTAVANEEPTYSL